MYIYNPVRKARKMYQTTRWEREPNPSYCIPPRSTYCWHPVDRFDSNLREATTTPSNHSPKPTFSVSMFCRNSAAAFADMTVLHYFTVASNTSPRCLLRYRSWVSGVNVPARIPKSCDMGPALDRVVQCRASLNLQSGSINRGQISAQEGGSPSFDNTKNRSTR